MPKITSGKRYAQAAFDLAVERNELESWQQGLRKIADLAKDEELMALLQNPRLPFPAKKSLLEKRLGEINPLPFNLTLLLVSKGILRRGGDIYQQYNSLLDFHRGIERAKVTTALPLGDEEGEAISRRLAEIVKRKVVIDAQVDPSIIGGFIARIGDTLIDASIHQKLETLRRSLVEAGR
ncbi:MAG: ATP synthase F1 subunit delta [Thermodesulfobacteriota bacterium]|nr:ATP synthase F1 subunit delta [Thermodesulfobacteriota bacterium]